jgi:hypothetical protein
VINLTLVSNNDMYPAFVNRSRDGYVTEDGQVIDVASKADCRAMARPRMAKSRVGRNRRCIGDQRHFLALELVCRVVVNSGNGWLRTQQLVKRLVHSMIRRDGLEITCRRNAICPSLASWQPRTASQHDDSVELLRSL